MWNDWRRREKSEEMKSQYHENMNQLWRSDHIERWLQFAAQSNTHTHTYKYKLKCELLFLQMKNATRSDYYRFKNVSIRISFLIVRIVCFERCLRVHVPWVRTTLVRHWNRTFMLLLLWYSWLNLWNEQQYSRQSNFSLQCHINVKICVALARLQNDSLLQLLGRGMA